MNQSVDFSAVLRRQPDAAATVRGSAKYAKLYGRALFYNVRNGVLVRAWLTGLPKGATACQAPIFAFHIHENGNCTQGWGEPFPETGGHYNPLNCPHPYHAGDMPPLFGADGEAFSVFLTNRFRIPEIIGRSVVLHGGIDDFTSQPAGNAGEKIACGIIQRLSSL